MPKLFAPFLLCLVKLVAEAWNKINRDADEAMTRARKGRKRQNPRWLAGSWNREAKTARQDAVGVVCEISVER